MSHGYYLLTRTTSINANEQFYKIGQQVKIADLNTPSYYDLFYRMPKKEFDVFYRLRPTYITGHFDHQLEILFPESKDGVDGYRIITPFYFFLCPAYNPNDPSGEKNYAPAGMAVDRGW
jgi:hypothetical protein